MVNLKKISRRQKGMHSVNFFETELPPCIFPGEHIDYCGYGVLPMAIEQDIIIGAAVTKDKKVVLHNTDENFK